MEYSHVVAVCVLGFMVTLSQGCTPAEQLKCKLPHCQCPGTTIPGNLTAAQTPQIVYVTFDDAINAVNYPMYAEILFPRKNPNNHSISGTFYVTHEYTDYNRTRDMWRRGHEIALHSITHQTNTEYWKTLNATGWREEILEQRTMLSHFASIPEASITGMRAPFLQTGGENMMRAIYSELPYDCSRPTLTFMNPGLWPYTMDFDTEFQDCQIQPCAVESYPGFWNVPMIDFIGDDGNPCAMVDQCLPNPNTTEKVVNLLKRNFLRSYEGNRAPIGLFTHSAWLSDLFAGHKDGYVEFLDYLGSLPDVYIVSIQKAIEWFKNPTPLDKIHEFAPWHVVELPHGCTPINCRFPPEDTPFGSERYMMSCKSCPPKFPWLGNPLGEPPEETN